MLYTPYLLRSQDQAQLDTVAELSAKPTLWAIPDLLPCHRLTLFAAPSGTGLSTLAFRLLAHYAPAPSFVTDSTSRPGDPARQRDSALAPSATAFPDLPTGFSPTDLSYGSYLQLRRRRPGPLPHARLQAMQFLSELLASGPLPVGAQRNPPPNSLRAQIQAAGLSFGTIRRAATDMNLRIFRTAECWYWQLPAGAPASTSLAHPTCASSPRGPLPVEAAAPQERETPPSTLNIITTTCAPSPEPTSSCRLGDLAVAAPSPAPDLAHPTAVQSPRRPPSSSTSDQVPDAPSSLTHGTPPPAPVRSSTIVLTAA